jgi:hypothetical protein
MAVDTASADPQAATAEERADEYCRELHPEEAMADDTAAVAASHAGGGQSEPPEEATAAFHLAVPHRPTATCSHTCGEGLVRYHDAERRAQGAGLERSLDTGACVLRMHAG